MVQSTHSSLCGLHRSRNQGGGGPNGPIVSVKRAADGRRQRSRKIIDKKREKYKAKNRSLRNTSTNSKGTTFVILKNHASVPVKKECSDQQLPQRGGAVPDPVWVGSKRLLDFPRVPVTSGIPHGQLAAQL